MLGKANAMYALAEVFAIALHPGWGRGGESTAKGMRICVHAAARGRRCGECLAMEGTISGIEGDAEWRMDDGSRLSYTV